MKASIKYVIEAKVKKLLISEAKEVANPFNFINLPFTHPNSL